jgi:membrane-associated protease RseP (regulator of RpoE activity)
MGMHMVMTPIRQWVYFRRQAALHEAGHIVIAKRFGSESFGYIFPRVPFEKIDSTDDKLWGGQTSGPLRKLQRLSRIRRCMIAVAGAVAEVGRGELDDILFYDPDVMSPTDWESAECEPGNPDRTRLRAVDKVAEIFNSDHGRSELYNMARALIVAARAFDEKAESIVDSHDGTNQIQHPTGTKGPVMNGEALFR